MKHIFLAIKVLAFLLLPVTVVHSQSSSNNAEEEIRRLEAKQVEYLMNGKVAEMKKTGLQTSPSYGKFTVALQN